MSINVEELASSMVEAFRGVLSNQWPDVQEYAKSEAKKLAENFAMIHKLRITNQITEEQAKLMLDIQKNAARAVLLTVEGLGLIAVELAIKAALNVVAEAVNAAIGFDLIPMEA